MPTQCSQEELDFGTSGGRKLVGAFDGGAITSNGGAVLLGAADRAIGLCDRLARCFRDLRDADAITHTVVDLLRQRIFGLALGYEDLIDHDALRFDPALTAVLDKPGGQLAGKSTLNRLEHAGKIGLDRHHKLDHDASAIERLFVDIFMEAHREPPVRIVLDLDATDDPLYGEQEGRHFHGYYDCYCYLPLYIFCGRHLLAAKLRSSSAGCRRRQRRGGRAHRRADPRALADDEHRDPRRQRLLPRRPDDLVRGQQRQIRARSRRQQTSRGQDRAADAQGEAQGQADGQAGARVRGLRVSHAQELELPSAA